MSAPDNSQPDQAAAILALAAAVEKLADAILTTGGVLPRDRRGEKGSEDPVYLNRKQLAEKAGISIRTFSNHEKSNVGNLIAAREKVPGFGLVYSTKKCQKYFSLLPAISQKGHDHCDA